MRGGVQAARDVAERFVREAEAEGRIAEIGVARRVLGLANTFLGDFAEARRHFEVALDSYDGERDSEVREKCVSASNFDPPKFEVKHLKH